MFADWLKPYLTQQNQDKQKTENKNQHVRKENPINPCTLKGPLKHRKPLQT
jgi:hypothetical protein